MKIENYADFSNKCKDIIKNNTPEKSLEKISNLKIQNNNKIGIDNAIKVYKCFSDNSVEWDDAKYSNNITSYKKKVNNNISKVVIHSKNI